MSADDSDELPEAFGGKVESDDDADLPPNQEAVCSPGDPDSASSEAESQNSCDKGEESEAQDEEPASEQARAALTGRMLRRWGSNQLHGIPVKSAAPQSSSVAAGILVLTCEIPNCDHTSQDSP